MESKEDLGGAAGGDRAIALMISDFYGINDMEDPPSQDFLEDIDKPQDSASADPDGATATPRADTGTSPPLSLDSPDFAADKFLEEVVRERNLGELADLDDSLTQEVRGLDAKMQNLVYENYNKFISATDTIREMKTKVEGMDDEMQKLVGNMENLAGACKGIADSMSDNRAKILKLSGVRQLLTNLNFLFNLPDRLKASISMGAFSQAVKDYKISSSYLRRHNHIESFKRIQGETLVLIKGLKNQLREVVQQSTTSTAVQMDYCGLLLDLDEAPEPLWIDVLATRKKHFAFCMNEAYQEAELSSGDAKEKEAREGKESKDGDPERKEKLSVIAALELYFVARFMEFANEFREMFVTPLLKKTEEGVPIGSKAAKAFSTFTKEVFNEYFTFVKKQLHLTASLDRLKSSPKLDPQIEINALVSDLTNFRDSVQSVVIFLNSLSSSGPNDVSAGINDQFDKLIDESVEECVDQSMLVLQIKFFETLATIFENVQQEFGFPRPKDPIYSEGDDSSSPLLDFMKVKLQESSSSALNSVADGAGKQITTVFVSAIQALKPLLVFQETPATRRQSFVKAMYRKTENALLKLAEAFIFGGFLDVDITGNPAGPIYKFKSQSSVSSSSNFLKARLLAVSETHSGYLTLNAERYSPTPLFALVLRGAATFFSAAGVSQVFSQLADCFPSRLAERSIKHQKAMFQGCASTLLKIYVEHHGYQLGRKLEKGLNPSIKLPAIPTDASPSIRGILNQLEVIKLELKLGLPSDSFFTSPPMSDRSLGPSILPRLPKRRDEHLAADIERIFAQRVEVFGPVKPEVPGILACVLKHLLKQLSEIVRVKTFQAGSVKQLQLDVYVLHLKLPSSSASEDKEALETLVDEVLASAADRCTVDAPFMEVGEVREKSMKYQ